VFRALAQPITNALSLACIDIHHEIIKPPSHSPHSPHSTHSWDSRIEAKAICARLSRACSCPPGDLLSGAGDSTTRPVFDRAAVEAEAEEEAEGREGERTLPTPLDASAKFLLCKSRTAPIVDCSSAALTWLACWSSSLRAAGVGGSGGSCLVSG